MYVTPSLTVGFHGCSEKVANDVLNGHQTLRRSENAYDWLGHGYYFWESSNERALHWAKKDKQLAKPSAVGAFLKLGNCLDLLNIEHLERVKAAHQLLDAELKQLGQSLPSNTALQQGIPLFRELDCKVLLRLQQFNNENIAQKLQLDSTEGQNRRLIQRDPDFIDSVRGMFPEGEELYPGAGFRSKNHIQICIINPNCMVGYFLPRDNSNSWYKTL